MNVIIDRFEEDYAVVELSNGSFLNIPKALFPGACEGDVISISINEDETSQRKERIEKLMDNLWED